MNLEEVKASVARLRARREEFTKLKDYRPQRGKGGSSGAAPANIDGLLSRLMARSTEQEPEGEMTAAEGGDSNARSEGSDRGAQARERSEGAQEPA